MNDLIQLFFPFHRHKAAPFFHDIIHIINSSNKGFNELFLAAQFRAGIHSFLNGDENLLVITVGIMVFLHQHQDVIDIDFNLADQFNLKNDVVGDVLFLALCTVYPLIPQILIPAQIILQVPLGDQFLPFELIKGQQQVAHPKDGSKEGDKLFLILLPLDPWFRQGELFRQFGDHIHIAWPALPILGGVAVVVIIELVQQDNAPGLSIAKQRNGGIHPLLQVAEADDVAEGLDGVQDAVGTAKGLDEAMHL